MANVPYIIDHIPRSTPYLRRTGIALDASTITIHNTGNPSSSALNERGWLTNPSNKRRASFHIAVDERNYVECVPLNEVALHAGTAAGNRSSIGIEICESGNYSKSLENAVELVAKLLKERSWGVDRLRRHFDWSGKVCPRLMYHGGTWAGWELFKARVAERLEVPKMEPKDAEKIIGFLQAAWKSAEDKEARAEYNRLANVIRKAAGMPVQ